MKNMILAAFAICSFSMNILALDLEEMKAKASSFAGKAADKSKSLASQGAIWAMYQKCMLESKLSGNLAENQKKCFEAAFEMKDARIAQLEAEKDQLKTENDQLKANQK